VEAASDLIVALSTPASSIDAEIGRIQQTLNDGSFASQEIREQTVQLAGTLVGQSSISDADKTKIVTFAVQQMLQEIALEPLDARLRMELANAYQIGGDIPDAAAQLEKAHELSPKKQEIIIQQGTLALAANDTKDAQTYFNTAYNLDTQFDTPAADAAASDILAGDSTTGFALLNQHFGTTTVDNDILLYAYYQTKQYALSEAIWKLRISTSDTADNRFNLAAAYAAAGDIADARATVQAAIVTHPDAAAQGQALLAELQKTQ
jgi:Flp pilus assembly protein TadD